MAHDSAMPSSGKTGLGEEWGMGVIHYAHGAVAVGYGWRAGGEAWAQGWGGRWHHCLARVGPATVLVAPQTLGAQFLLQVGLGSTGLGSPLAHGEWLWACLPG